MGNVNMEAYQVHYEGKSVAEKLKELDAIAQQIEDLPTFTSNDRVFLEAVPAMPTEEGKKVLTATTDGQGNTELTYDTPEVKGSDIAPTFSEDVTYSAGILVYYEGNLYKFTKDHTAGAWDPSEVTPASAAAEFVETNAAVNELKNTLIAFPNYSDSGIWLLNDNTNYPYTYTVQSDGFLVFQRCKCSNNGGERLAINGNQMVSCSGDLEFYGGTFPVKKGDILVFSNLSTLSRARFVYAL